MAAETQDTLPVGVGPFLQPGASLSPETHLEAGEGATFKLRVGPNYKKNGKKAPSASQMYRMVGIDIFRSEKGVSPIAPLFDLSTLGSAATKEFTHPSVPRIFIINAVLPDFSPSMLGKKDGGPWLHIVIFFEITPESAEMIHHMDSPEQCDPAHRLFAQWCKEAEEDVKMRSRLKFFVHVHNYEAIGLPSMLAGYNAKPLLITNSGTFFRGPGNSHIEMTINVGVFGFIARKGLHSLKHRLPEMDCSFGLCIEARQDEEMPERCVLLGRARKLEGFNVPFFLSDEAIAFLQKTAHA